MAPTPEAFLVDSARTSLKPAMSYTSHAQNLREPKFSSSCLWWNSSTLEK